MQAAITLQSLAPALPEIFMVAAICVVLLADVFAGAAARRITPTLTLVVIALGAALTILHAQVPERVVLFSGMYVADPLGTLLKLLGFLFTGVALLYSRAYLEARNLLKGEYYVLVLTALLGIFVIVSAGSLLTLYIGVELLALSLYALVAFDRDSGIAAESAMKYFVLGAIASGCLLYGMSLVYGMSGSLLLADLAVRLQGEASLGLIMGIVFLVVGVAFKFGAVPFHMWVPDVYQGAPSSVTLFVATAPKIASFALAFRLLAGGLGQVAGTWMQMLSIVAIASLVLGNVVAIAQTSLKRMLAYSAIGNVGFILLGFVAGTEQGYEAALYYTVVYVLMTLGSFGVILLASRAGFEASELDDYKGLHARDPLLALIMMVLMFSTAGIPPFVGFWAKLQIFQALWAVNQMALVVCAAAVSVIGVFYYLRVVKLMYFDAPTEAPRGFAH
ncbi:MAG: hypothetical protein RL603_436, partial [Pseudomonadota bacterium]